MFILSINLGTPWSDHRLRNRLFHKQYANNELSGDFRQLSGGNKVESKLLNAHRVCNLVTCKQPDISLDSRKAARERPAFEIWGNRADLCIPDSPVWLAPIWDFSPHVPPSLEYAGFIKVKMRFVNMFAYCGFGQLGSFYWNYYLKFYAENVNKYKTKRFQHNSIHSKQDWHLANQRTCFTHG